MRISTKGRHAVIAMVDLARNGLNRPISLAAVAERQEISLSYLEQLVARLKAEGLLISTRGPGGGYQLAKASDTITIGDVVRAVDDPFDRVHVMDPMTATGRQLTDLLWQAIGDQIADYLSNVTIADVCNCSLCKDSDVPSDTEHMKEILGSYDPLAKAG